MNPDNTVEYNSLSWVKVQLDDVLSDAQSNLNEYIDNKHTEHLENCIEYLQLIYGTLQMVEVYGAAMLAQEMLQTTTALLKGEVENDEDAYDVLMRAMLQLPDYLETIQAGSKDTPITLMPLFNDLRAARKEGLLSESVLFSPEIEDAELDSNIEDGASIKAGNLQVEVKKLRTHYQIGLLDFIRNQKEQVGLKRIKAVLNALEKVSSSAEVRRIWIVISTLAEGLIKQGIDSNLSIKMLLGAVDRQLKLILDIDEKKFETEYSKELVKNALYYIGLCSVESERITAVKEAYKLNELMPQHEKDAATSIGGLNSELFNTVSKGITQDIEQVKDVLEVFMHSSDHDVEPLVGVVDQLGKIADTYGMLGMGATRQTIMEQCAVLNKITDGSAQPNEAIISGVAFELLNAESELKEYISTRSGVVDATPQLGNQIVPASEYREVIRAVVKEALKNFSEAKEAVLSYVSGSGDKEQFEIILDRLNEVHGVAMMLPLVRVCSQIEKLQEYIQVALIDNDRQAVSEEQDTIADVVTSIEYYFEALSEGRPGVEHGLNAGDKSAAKLEKITASYTGASLSEVEDNAVKNSHDEMPEIDSVDADIENISLANIDSITDLETDAEQKAGVHAVNEDFNNDNVLDDLAFDRSESLPETEDVTESPEEIEALSIVEDITETTQEIAPDSTLEETKQLSDAINKEVIEEIEKYEILADDADEEIVEIFIEEAIEVLEELHENVPKWQDNPADDETLNTIRRGFHTLKGSGRIIGAQLIGEFSWKIEHLLNKVLEKKIATGDSINEVLDESLAVIPQLIEQLKGNREPIDNITQLMLSIDAITAGRIDDYEILKKNGALADIGKRDANSDIATAEYLSSATDNVVDEFEDVPVEMEIDEAYLVDINTKDNSAKLNDDLESSDTDEITINDYLTDSNDDEEIMSLDSIELTDNESEEVAGSSVKSSEQSDADESIEYKIEIDESGFDNIETGDLEVDESGSTEVDSASEGVESDLDIDPVLLTIYYGESQSHIKTVQKLVADSSVNNNLRADKNLLRAFHTLYGSARTAGIEPIAELSGATEKYIKARQDIGEEAIPQDITDVISDVEKSISVMLAKVKGGKLPASDRALHDKINKVVKQELQEQLQSTWQNDIPANDEMADNSADNITVDATELKTNVKSDNSDEADHQEKNYASSSNKKDKAPEEKPAATPYSDIDYVDIDEELIDIFLEEADELLESCESIVNQIKSEPDSIEHVQKLQRDMHTLKGGARMAGLTPVGDLTHNLESLVVMVENKKIRADKILLNVLHESLDALTTMLAEVKQRKPLINAIELNQTIESLMRGEVQEKRAVERFDVELDALHSAKAERDAIEGVASEDRKGVNPHWGERASDVNYKDTQEQVRVRADLLNNLVNYAGEVNIYHARMGKQISDYSFNLSELSQTVDRLKTQLRNLEIETEIQIRSGYEKESESFDDSFDPLEMDQYSTMQQLTRSFSETAADVESIKGILSDITRDSETLLIQESRVSSELQEGLMRTRMVRFGGLSSRLGRIVRQVSKELGKEVELEITGESSEVDRTVLDRVIAPLEHMLRNAVAHGIEKPDMRRTLGKSEAGKITIEVSRQGTDVVIDVEDDGTGIDAEKIKQKAIKQGLLEADADVSEHDVLQFILQSGFSTAEEVTQVSGRGVGMDVVDSEIKQLGGVMDIETRQGKGTKFHIRLPLTLAINQALLVKASDDVFAVPLASIEGVVRITGHELQRFYDSGQDRYGFNDIEYELKHLGGMLTGNQSDYTNQLQLFPVLLVHVGEQHFALHVDDLIGRREIVVKPVGLQIGAVRGIAGATILADGRVVLILEMSALVVAESLFKIQREIEQEVEKAVSNDKKTIMVVDDSITIRKVTERILQRYGIEVILAKDGVDATSQLQERIPDLMLLDIEMPRMDGFEVASFVRNDENLKDLPIIMITSRTGAKHKEKAMEIGVNQYLGKPFQEEDLISNINNILKTSF